MTLPFGKISNSVSLNPQPKWSSASLLLQSGAAGTIRPSLASFMMYLSLVWKK